MGRAPCCDKAKVKRGPWSPEEDTALKNYVQTNGTGGNWIALPHKAGLKRCGKSCRLRWLNYLRPDIKHGGFTEEEDNFICTLYKSIGSRWSVIASQLPGRTDNDVKNYWNTKLKKKLLAAKTSVIHQLSSSSSSSSSSPTLLTTKHEIFSTCLNHQNSTTLIPPPSMDFAGLVGQAADHSQRLVDLEDPIHHHFPHQPGLMEATKFGKNADINSTTDRNIVSSCQEISGLSSVASSSFNLDENFFLWSGNEGGDHEDDRLSSMGFGFSSYSDIDGFFGFHQERIITNEADAANLADSLSDNFLRDPSDAKSQLGLYQSVANYGFSSTMS